MLPHDEDSAGLLEREATRIVRRGQSLLSQALVEGQPNSAALLAVADDLTSLIDRLTAEKQCIEEALRNHDRRIRAVTAYARN